MYNKPMLIGYRSNGTMTIVGDVRLTNDHEVLSVHTDGEFQTVFLLHKRVERYWDNKEGRGVVK
jgi:hypothetical protein